ncbi:hypothetical protein LIER_30014 [Lithospermum erythrorhizon]|uniref:Replication factor A C-terminal domain-containing protein n=1 Tax=Lithospermum erythrorhizon TaxID=34254 RepID=A0AAV3RRE0_LITER
MTSTIGPLLVQAANNNWVFLARRLKITRYGVISLRSKNGSSFALNPPVKAATNMKSWFDTVRDDNETEGGDYWIRGLLQLYEADQRLYYIGCNNCFTKIDVDPGVTYDCHFCEKKVVFCIRPLVIMSVTDDTGSSDVVVVGSVAERIMQTTTDQIAELKKMGQPYDLNSVRTDFENKIFLMLLRRGSGKKAGIQRRPLLVAYYDETSTDKGQVTNNALSRLKRQMNKLAIGLESSSAKRQLTMTPANNNTPTRNLMLREAHKRQL